MLEYQGQDHGDDTMNARDEARSCLSTSTRITDLYGMAEWDEARLHLVTSIGTYDLREVRLVLEPELCPLTEASHFTTGPAVLDQSEARAPGCGVDSAPALPRNETTKSGRGTVRDLHPS